MVYDLAFAGLELPVVLQDLVPLSYLIDRVVSSAYSDLATLVETRRRGRVGSSCCRLTARVHVESRAPLERQQLASIRAGWTRKSTISVLSDKSRKDSV
jgi:hypothetical protein